MEAEPLKTRTLFLAALMSAAALAARAQNPVAIAEGIEKTATIVAIDHTARVITLENETGSVELAVGPEVKRFGELKVGDKITFRYRESLLVQVQKPGEAKPKAAGAPAVTRGTGAKPSATIAQQQTATVTIKAIDPKVPSITVTTADGHTLSHKVEDKKLLEGYKVGDKVDITYTEALMISVK
jgi:Cu/Ag efflux protein CusF